MMSFQILMSAMNLPPNSPCNGTVGPEGQGRPSSEEEAFAVGAK